MKTEQEIIKETWAKVFQVISDCNYRDMRELIEMLETARDQDGAGPQLSPPQFQFHPHASE